MNWNQLLSTRRDQDREPSPHSGDRSAFEQDYVRIVFSYPFRRLQDKTQVFPLPEDDFVHTRLTHSLEVSSVGRSLGKSVGHEIIQRNPTLIKQGFNSSDFGSIVSAASLAHDLGNPPFGHSGEDAISDFFQHHEMGLFFKGLMSEKEWSDVTSFEGNAQGFRILNKKRHGLKLTYATLGAFSKYPRESKISEVDKARRSQKKYGFFQKERIEFSNIASDLGLIKTGGSSDMAWTRHPLAFLVEGADDICYHIIDLEDGCTLGLVSLDETVSLLVEIIGSQFDKKKFDQLPTVYEKIGMLRAMAIGKLAGQCASLFLDNESQILEGKYDVSLADDIPAASTLSSIIDLSVKKIYRSKVVLETEAAGFEVIAGLLSTYTHAAYNSRFEEASLSKKQKAVLRVLPVELQAAIGNSESVYELIMNCIDHVASMTDSYALRNFQKIRGITLPTY